MQLDLNDYDVVLLEVILDKVIPVAQPKKEQNRLIKIRNKLTEERKSFTIIKNRELISGKKLESKNWNHII
jgi:hypothetical protein